MSPSVDTEDTYFSRRRLRRWPRWMRLGVGILLVCGGLLGFLPVLGFWMIPLGLAVLSIDLPIVRRWWRRLQVWWGRRVRGNNGRKPPADLTKR